LLSESGHCSRVRSEKAKSLIDGGAGKRDEVFERTIKREHAAGEHTTRHGPSIVDLHSKAA